MKREILNREEFFDLFQPPSKDRKGSPPDQLPLRGGSGAPAIEVLWSKDSNVDSMPSVCIVKKENMRDFLAWAATYLPSASPLTAFCRVVTPEVFDSLPRKMNLPPTMRDQEGGVVGVILAEALSYFDGRDDSTRLSLAACARTFSHAMARAMLLGYEWPLVQRAGVAWQELREVTGQTATSTSTNDLQTCWRVIYSLYSEDQGRDAQLDKDLKVILSACEDIRQRSDISSDIWQSLTRDLSPFAELRGLMTGPREDRVVVVEKVLSTFPTQNLLRDQRITFVIGYLASRISPGTLDHYGLLRSKVPMSSLALIWYGLCSGLASRGDLRDASGLSLRLFRDLQRPSSIEERPDCDISIDELKVLMSAVTRESGIKPGNPNTLEVELIPLVKSTVRWSASRAGETGELFNTAMIKDVSRLIEDLGHLTKRADYIASSLGKYFPPNDRTDDLSRSVRRKRN